MITVQGTVKNGMVKLPTAVKLSDGSRVMVTFFLIEQQANEQCVLKNIEAEDVDFVRACRGRLAKQLCENDE